MSTAQDQAGGSRLAALLAIGLNRAFGGLKAASNVSFDVAQGAITALIGPNGAGKTILFNLITKIFPPDTGKVSFHGSDLRGWPPERIAKAGLIRTFQSARVFPGMTVLENVLTGCHRLLRSGIAANMLRLPHAGREEIELAARAETLIDLIGLSHHRNTHAADLPMGSQKMPEVVRALMAEPRMLLLDEPAAGLTDSETAELAALLLAIRQNGITVLLVEHNMSLVMSVADRVIVLKAGKVIANGTPADVQSDPRVIASYLGSADPETSPEPQDMARCCFNCAV